MNKTLSNNHWSVSLRLKKGNSIDLVKIYHSFFKLFNKLILGIKTISHCQKGNDRAGFNIITELINQGIRGQLQQGKSMQDIGEIFISGE